jgi:SanA protein
MAKSIKKGLKIILLLLTLLFLIMITFYCFLLFVHQNSADFIVSYKSVKDLPQKKAAIILGASVNPATNLPSDILADRILTGAELYKEGKVEKLIMSGDNRVTHYNEPVVMRDYAVALGVPLGDIVLDYAGRRTYDTCFRANKIFGIEEAYLVSQRYHLFRAVYTCRALGVDVIGVDAARQLYVNQFSYNVREIPATILALWEIYLIHPSPVLGEKIEINLPL